MQGWSRLWEIDGLANQYIFARYLQPSEFAVLGLLAIALMLYGRWRIAVLLLAITTNIHEGYLVHFSIVVMAAAIWLLARRKVRPAVEMLLVFGLANLPVFIGGPLAFALEPGAAETEHLLATVRIPHHTLPWLWWSAQQAQKILFMVAAAILLIWKVPGLLRWLMWAGLMVVLAGILAVMATRSEGLALMHLWRGSIYLYPISQLVILAFVGFGLLRLAQCDGRMAAAGPALQRAAAGDDRRRAGRAASGPCAEQPRLDRQRDPAAHPGR